MFQNIMECRCLIHEMLRNTEAETTRCFLRSSYFQFFTYSYLKKGNYCDDIDIYLT